MLAWLKILQQRFLHSIVLWHVFHKVPSTSKFTPHRAPPVERRGYSMVQLHRSAGHEENGRQRGRLGSWYATHGLRLGVCPIQCVLVKDGFKISLFCLRWLYIFFLDMDKSTPFWGMQFSRFLPSSLTQQIEASQIIFDPHIGFVLCVFSVQTLSTPSSLTDLIPLQSDGGRTVERSRCVVDRFSATHVLVAWSRALPHDFLGPWWALRRLAPDCCFWVERWHVLVVHYYFGMTSVCGEMQLNRSPERSYKLFNFGMARL